MTQIAFQFSTIKDDFIDWIIREKTKSEISHVDAIMSDGRLLGSQLDSNTGPGVQIRNPGYKKFTKTITVTLFLQIGKPYDVTAVFGLALHRDWREKSKWFCSEELAAAAEESKFLTLNIEVDWISPEMFLELLCASPYFISKIERNL